MCVDKQNETKNCCALKYFKLLLESKQQKKKEGKKKFEFQQ